MFNEEAGAARCVDTVIEELGKIKSKMGLIVVNGPSTDNTFKILVAKKRKYKNKLVVLNTGINLGYGGALRVGMKEADRLGYDFALCMDSDLTNNPADISRFAEKAVDSVDCVKATRYSPGGAMVGVPFYRQVISKIGNWFASWCFGVGLSDCTNGFRMVRLKFIREINLTERGYSSILEELYELKKRKARFLSLPVTLTARTGTKTHFSYSWRTFFDYGRYSIKAAMMLTES